MRRGKLTKRAIKAGQQAREVAAEAIEVAQQATEVAEEAIAQKKEYSDTVLEIAKLAMQQTDRAVQQADQALNLARLLRMKLETTPNQDVLSADELRAFAEATPQWTVTAGIADGKPVKVYKRNINEEELVLERRAGGELERDTYLSLADVEHSDFCLASIFDTYSFDGDYINGRNYQIRIYSEEPGPITYGDFVRVLDAEAYLKDAGYLLTNNEPASV